MEIENKEPEKLQMSKTQMKQFLKKYKRLNKKKITKGAFGKQPYGGK